MDTKVIHIRVDRATAEKIEALLELYSSKTKVVAVAIDRLYQAERQNRESINAAKSLT